MHQPLPLGTVLQTRYYLIDLLAQGKSSRTYLAKDIQSSNELRALQELTLPQADAAAQQQALERLQAEAHALYRIQHPQIQQLYGAFAQEGRLFLVRECVEGKSCRTLLRERKAVPSLAAAEAMVENTLAMAQTASQPQSEGAAFLQDEVWRLLLLLLPALEHLHSMGMSHGNISPESIILPERSDGGKQVAQLPVLIDLAADKELVNRAIERAADGDAGAIASPETIPSASSDLYSLAVTALILLTGRETPELFDNGQLRKDWPQRAAVSPALAGVLNRMLSDDAKERYQSAGAVAKALRSLTEPTAHKRQRKGESASNYFWAYAISLGLVLVVGIGSWAVLNYLLSPLSVSPSARSSAQKRSPSKAGAKGEKPVISRRLLNAVPDKPARVGGSLKENETLLYVIPAKTLQKLTASLTGEGVSMTVLDPKQKPMPGSSQPLQQWEGGLFSPGDYAIQLSPGPGAGQSEYKLEVRLGNYFPQKSCEDPSAGGEGTWHPVLVPYSAQTLKRLQAQFCRNTVVVLKDGGGVQVQVGSFGERSRAEAFASAIKGAAGTAEVGEPTTGSPRRACGDRPEGGAPPQYPVFAEYTKEKYIRILSYCPNASVAKRPDRSGSYIEVAAFADKSKAEEMAALISTEVGGAEVGEPSTPATAEPTAAN